MSYPPQPPGSSGNQPGWGQPGSGQQGWGQQQGYYHQAPPQNQSQDFWRQVAAGSRPPPPKRRRTGLIVGLVCLGLVAVIGVGITVLVVVMNNNTIAAGDCLELKNEGGGEVEKAQCRSAESDYEVVEVIQRADRDACPDNYSNAWNDVTYCMVLDVRVGDCLSSFREDESVLPIKADCAAANTEDQVTKVEPNADAETACAEEEGYYIFDKPARTVCFGDVKGT